MSLYRQIRRLQKVLKTGQRRCKYRRWEIIQKGKNITVQTTDLERLYRGITPHPISPTKISKKAYSNLNDATKGYKELVRRKKSAGYS